MKKRIDGVLSVIEAGRKGGLVVFERKGRQHYSEIGKKGQRVMRAKYPGMASAWGKKGGRPPKGAYLFSPCVGGEKGKK